MDPGSELPAHGLLRHYSFDYLITCPSCRRHLRRQIESFPLYGVTPYSTQHMKVPNRDSSSWDEGSLTCRGKDSLAHPHRPILGVHSGGNEEKAEYENLRRPGKHGVSSVDVTFPIPDPGASISTCIHSLSRPSIPAFSPGSKPSLIPFFKSPFNSTYLLINTTPVSSFPTTLPPLAFVSMKLQLVPFLSVLGSASAVVHTVTVGSGGLVYSPASITAAVGDTVEFSFSSQVRLNQEFPPTHVPMRQCLFIHSRLTQLHSVIQGSFDAPCQPLAGGWFSQFLRGPSKFTVVVESTDPQVFYCAVDSHCQNGMVGVINP